MHSSKTPPPTYASATTPFTPSPNAEHAVHKESELKEFEFFPQTFEQVELGGMIEIQIELGQEVELGGQRH